MSGEVFGPYRLGQLLGRGGMGEVHRAVDTRKGRTVALKRLPPGAADPESRERFVREAQTASRLHEPHVIPIHDYGEIDGQLFLDMRLVEGHDLGVELARGGLMSPSRAVDIVAQAAGALDAAHRSGLVHRDVKPANMLLSGDQGVDHVYLVDFGIAHAVNRTHLTATGVAVGTVAYMAPERFVATTTDQRSDIYSLGCVLYEALTGRAPFAGRDGAQLMWAHAQLEPQPPSLVRPSVPRGLDAVVARAMAKDPAARFDHAGAFAEAARSALARETPHSAVPTWVPPPAQPVDRPEPPAGLPRSATVALVALGLALTAVIALFVVTALAAPGWLVNPGDPAPVADEAVAALASKDTAGLTDVSCRRLDGSPAAQFPPELLALIGQARPSGTVRQTLDTEARMPVDLTLNQGGQSQTLPADLLFGVTDDAWCLNGISQRQ